MAFKEEIASSVAKLTPPAAITAATKFTNMTLSDWVLLATLVYTLLQIAYLLRKWFRPTRPLEDEA